VERLADSTGTLAELKAMRSRASWLLALLLVAAPAGAESPLVDAVKHGDRAAVRALLDKHVDVNRAEPDGSAPLHWAVYGERVEIEDLLIRAGATVRAANRYGATPLWLAAVSGNAAMIDLLLKAGADVNAANTDGETALLAAARSGKADAVRVLLDRGAHVNEKERWRGQTPLMWAAAEGHVPVVTLLIDRGADVHARSNGGFTPLLFAAREGRIGSVDALLRAGADLKDALPRRKPGGASSSAASEPNAGLNALLLAVENAHYELAALLLDRGADATSAPKGWTALHQISWVRKTGVAGSNNPAPQGSGNMDALELVKKLVAHGADLNARVTERPGMGITTMNAIGATPFLLAARTADADLMRALLALGADPKLTNDDGTTALMIAAGVGTSSPGEDPGTEPEVLEAVTVALDAGLDINGVDKNGETAMHGAAYKHVPSVVRFLAQKYASVDAWNRPNKKGWTPLTIAEGIQRGMNIVSSPVTAAAIREVLTGASATAGPQAR
jgi:ankyrin repeat protein